MSYLDDIDRIERAAKKKGVSLVEFFNKAEIAASTWTRWRNQKTSPNYKVWERVEAAAKEMRLNGKAA